MNLLSTCILLAGLSFQYNLAYQECLPRVKFKHCSPMDTRKNPFWNIESAATSLSIGLDILPYCDGSFIEVQWLLLDKKSGRTALNMRQYRNKHVVIFPPNTLKSTEYVLLARVQERAFMKNSKTIEVSCWIRVLKKDLYRREQISPRANNTKNYQVVVYTNTAEKGWKVCANPHMPIYVSGKNVPMHTFFGENSYFDTWVYNRTQWIVGTWSWRASYSYTLERTSTWFTGLHIYTESYSVSGTVYCSKRMPNYTGRVGYPLIYGNSFSGTKINFPLTIKDRKPKFRIITDLKYYKRYRFLICEDRDTYALGCANRTTFKMCVNWGEQLRCKANPRTPNILPTSKVSFDCEQDKKGDMGNIKFGVYTKDQKTISGKGSPDLLMGIYDKMTGIEFRLFVSRARHTVLPAGMDHETHVALVCTSKFFCDKTYFMFTVTSALGSGSIEQKFLKLNELKDGSGAFSAFKSVVGSGEINDITQIGHILATESDYLDIDDLARNTYQADLLKALQEQTKLTFGGVEMMVGLLQRFDMDGISREIYHSLAKAANVKFITAQFNVLVSSLSYPMVTQIQMETIYFPELFRQVALLFDSDYVKPFSFSIGQADSVPIHICNEEFYQNYNDETDETIVADYKTITNDGILALVDLLYTRSLAHFDLEYHIDAQENAVTSRIFIEKGNVNFVIKNLSRVFYLDMGDPDYMQPNQSFTFIWAILDKNMFFWSKDALRYHTPYVLIYYYFGSSSKISGFTIKPQLVVKMIGSLEVPLRQDGLTVPTEADQWTTKLLDRFIRAYRIKLDDDAESFTFAMFLHNITLVKRLRVVIVHTVKKPRFDAFDDPENELIVFDSNKTSHFIEIRRTNFWFICVLPYQEDIVGARKKRDVESDVTKGVGKNTVTLKYTFRFLKLACPVFNDTFQYSLCEVSENTTIKELKCVCDTLGMPIGASIMALPYKVYGILDISIRLSLAVEYVIIIATILAILFYCLLLVLAPYRSKPMELVFFCADNSKSNRYGYLLKVKTGDYLKSGTSGHIGIQLYGEASNSKRHILNYPDPDRKLLNNGNVDHFLIATQESLGKLRKIEIWSDCSGYEPEWYCDNIRISDLQQNTSTNFAIQKRLGLTGSQQCHYFVTPSKSNQVITTSPWAYLNFHFGAMHSWNLFDASQDMAWSYMERMTVVLSHVLSTFALTLVLIHPIRLVYKDGIGENNKDSILFYVMYVAIVTVVVAPVNFIFAALFRDCQKTGRFSGTYGRHSPRVHLIIWVCLVVLITVCLCYCLICGPFIAYTVVYDWSVIVLASLLINIFFCENLLLALHAVARMTFVAMSSSGTHKSSQGYRGVVQDVENQRVFLYRSADTAGLRPQLQELYTPLSGEMLRKSRQECKDKSAIAETFESMINLWTFGILLVILIVFYFNADSAGLNRHLEDMFVLGAFGDIKLKLAEIYSYEDIYKYLNESMMFALTPLIWYRPYAVNDPGILSDMASKYLGSVRLRQKRVTFLEECPDKEFVMKHWETSVTCIPPYHEDLGTKNSTYDLKAKHNKSMWWFHEEEIWNHYHGALMTYNGDGYPFRFGKIRANGLYQIQSLSDSEWLDKYTKVLILEMVIYNAYTNLFTDLKVVFEREAQLIWPSYRMHTAQLMVISDFVHTLNMIVFMIYIIVSARMLMLSIRRLVRKRWGMFQDVYAFTLIFVQVLNVLSIVLFMQKLTATAEMLEDLKHKKRNEYFLYSHVVYTQFQLEIVIAVMLFTATLLLLEFMKFFRWTAASVKALKMSFLSLLLLSFGVWFAITSFGVMGQILFGATFEEFMVYAVGPMMCLMMISRLGAGREWGKLWDHDGAIVKYMYVTFALISWFLRCAFIIISIRAFHMAKVYVSDEEYQYTLRQYAVEKVVIMKHNMFRRFKIRRGWRRKRGGEDPDEKLIRPRVDKYRYRDQFVLSEWAILRQRSIVLALLRNTYQREPGDVANEEDMRLMKAVARTAIGGSKPEIEAVTKKMHFTGRQPFSNKTRTVLVPDTRIERMATAAEAFLKDRKMKVEATNTDPIEADEDPSLLPEKRRQELIKSVEDVDKAVTVQTQQLARIYVILNSTDAIIDLVAEYVYSLKPKPRPDVCCKRK